MLFLPFTGLLVKLATASVPAEETQEDPLAKLVPRFLTTPSLALDQAQRCIADMGDTAKTRISTWQTTRCSAARLQTRDLPRARGLPSTVQRLRLAVT